MSTTTAATTMRKPSEKSRSREMQATAADSPLSAKDLSKSALSMQMNLDAMHREHAKLQQAIYEAAQIQRNLCAPRELIWGNFEIAGEIFPVRHLSGDFFKVMELGESLGLAVGDIAGKGLSAGIWQAHLMHLVQHCARNHAEPADAVAEVNRELCRDQAEPPLTALFFARLDPDGAELTYCNAGLPAALLVRRDKSVDRLDEGGPMLGALKDSSYNSGRVRLNPGDMLLAYSDGLTECRNSRDEEFEMARLSATVNALNGASANQVLFSTLGSVLDFADSCTPGDDLTLLVVRHRDAVSLDATSLTVSGSKEISTVGRPPMSKERTTQTRRTKRQ
ncbi:MAG TPA: PP2C family protein-serine/threonine phosphatase [Candidatus Acidoferrum sp.]|jgi:sigma-B regulation protein RsbU (phosphoserine phosphatase)